MQETQETQFDPWVGRIPWRRKWQPTPVILPGEFHGWRSLEGYSHGVAKHAGMVIIFLSIHALQFTSLASRLSPTHLLLLEPNPPAPPSHPHQGALGHCPLREASFCPGLVLPMIKSHFCSLLSSSILTKYRLKWFLDGCSDFASKQEDDYVLWQRSRCFQFLLVWGEFKGLHHTIRCH